MPTIAELHKQLHEYGKLSREARTAEESFGGLYAICPDGRRFQQEIIDRWKFYNDRQQEVREQIRAIEDLETERKAEVIRAEILAIPSDSKSDRSRGRALLDSLRAR